MNHGAGPQYYCLVQRPNVESVLRTQSPAPPEPKPTP